MSTDVEMIYIASKMLQSVGIEADLHINSIGTVEERARYDELFRSYAVKYRLSSKTWYDIKHG